MPACAPAPIAPRLHVSVLPPVSPLLQSWGFASLVQNFWPATGDGSRLWQGAWLPRLCRQWRAGMGFPSCSPVRAFPLQLRCSAHRRAVWGIFDAQLLISETLVRGKMFFLSLMHWMMMLFFINNDTFDQHHGKCGQFWKDLILYKETEWKWMDEQIFATGILLSFQAYTWVIPIEKKILYKIQKDPGITCQTVFLFLISESLHLEIKVLPGFDLKSSEAKGRFFFLRVIQ